MNTTPRWLARAGAILVMMGFFLPAASCSAFSITGGSFSLSDLADLGESSLYLVLLGAVAALALSWIRARDSRQQYLFLVGQAAALGLGGLSFAGTMLSLYSDFSDVGLDLNPEIGFFLLIVGYALAGIGTFLSFAEQPTAGRPPPWRDVVVTPRGVHLERVRGPAPSVIPIDGADFLIGRSQRNHLVLSDTIVSGLHARLRFAQGAWFIQDQNSSNGTYVNGRKVTAQRLNDGDQIRLGESTFIFRM